MPTLRAHCAERVAAGEAAQTVDMLLDLIEAMSERMTRLEQQVDRLLRERYARKSERISSAQLTLALDAAATPLLLPAPDSPDSDDAPASPDPALSAPARRRRKVRKLCGDTLPAHLPRTRTVLEPTAEQRCCTACGSEKKWFFREVSG